MTYLLRCGHKVDGGVVAVVLLREAEGELVVDEEGVCFEGDTRGLETVEREEGLAVCTH